MERRQFTREFKLEAVRLIKQRGVSYALASADLGVQAWRAIRWLTRHFPVMSAYLGNYVMIVCFKTV
jgi:transposase-like protein